MHAAVPSAALYALEQAGVGAEGFASPLNAVLPSFYSACPDTDAAFGSQVLALLRVFSATTAAAAATDAATATADADATSPATTSAN
jgi:phosphorylated CTD interacting factor 1-like protein